MFKGFFLLLLISCIGLYAHQTGLSYIEMKEDKSSNIDVVYKKPLADTQADDIFIHYPAKCFQKRSKIKKIEDGFIIDKYQLWCSKSGLLDSRIWVDGLVSSDRGIHVRYEKGEFIQTALLRSTTPFIYINQESSKSEMVFEYIELGVVHILAGYDHLLFVLGLFLLSRNMKSLLYAISGFTISHSITLAFGILGILTIEIAYVEAMIALSIVFLARELVVANQNSLTRNYLGLVAFIFGLLHGFGFSSVLSSIGLPQGEVALSLFAFNLGIELGQIFFIAFLGIFFIYLSKYFSYKKELLDKIGGYIVGAFSAFWLIERVISF